MEEYIISGIIYTEIDDIVGPNPEHWLPQNIPEDTRMKVAIKAITMLTAEYGLIPKSLSFIPFPSLKLKAIIKYFQWTDENRRGGVGKAALTLLFKEDYDVVFYKGIDSIEPAFEEIAQKLIHSKELKAGREIIAEEIEKFNDYLVNMVDNLRISETTQLKPFPTKDNEIINYQFKVIICGDPTVGKTSIILRFTNNAFNRKYISTIGINVSDKVISVSNINVQLVLWDTAGQSKFQFIRAPFYIGAKGVFLIFDLTNPKSFESIRTWYDDIKKNINERLIGFIIGNKKDEVEKRKITKEMGIKLARELNLEYFETSALTGDNVFDSFYKMANSLYYKNR